MPHTMRFRQLVASAGSIATALFALLRFGHVRVGRSPQAGFNRKRGAGWRALVILLSCLLLSSFLLASDKQGYKTTTVADALSLSTPVVASKSSPRVYDKKTSSVISSAYSLAAAAIKVGDRVETNATVNVRQTAAGTSLGTQSSGKLGTVIGGPTVASLSGTSYTWFNINFDTGIDGWVADIGLDLARCDIIVQGTPTISPNPVTAGNSITVKYVIRNNGSGNAGTSQTKIQIKNSSGTQITAPTFSAPAISASTNSPSQSNSVTIPAGTPAGTYTAYVILDNQNQLNQSNTSNDLTPGVNFTVSAPVQQLPNLVPQNITLNKSSAQAGSTLTINWTLANTGSGNSPATVTGVRMNQSSTSHSGTTITNVAMPALNANSTTPQTATITIPSGTAPGTYYVWIIADNVSSNPIQQSNINDDFQHSAAFTVTATTSQLPNLLPQNITLNKTAVQGGDTLTVNWALANTGSGSSPGTVTGVRMSQSSSSGSAQPYTSFPTVMMPALNGNSSTPQTATITIPSGISAGTYYIWIIADNVSSNPITQSNYTDDFQRSAAFTVTVGTPCGDAGKINETILKLKKYLNDNPPLDYLPNQSLLSFIVSFRLQAYKELYYSGLKLRGLEADSLAYASQALSRGDLNSACKAVQKAQVYQTVTVETESNAVSVWQNRLDISTAVLRSIYDGSRAAFIFGLNFTGPHASLVADILIMPLDFAVDSSMYGEDEAIKRSEEKIREVFIHFIIGEVPIPNLGGKSITEFITKGVNHEVGASGLYTLLEQASQNPTFHRELVTKLAEVLGHLGTTAIERIATELENSLRDAIQSAQSSQSRLTSKSTLAAVTSTSPTVINTAPTSAAAFVSVSLNSIVVTFSENVQLGARRLTITDAGGNSIATSSSVVNGSTLSASLSSTLNRGTIYTVSIPSDAVRNGAGVSNNQYEWTFATSPPPLSVGSNVVVANTGSEGLRLRSSPALLTNGSNVLTVLPEGTKLSIVGGPVQADGYKWWNVSGNGLTGWSAVGDWLSPNDLLGLRIGAAVTVANTNGIGLNLRTEPTTSATKITTLADGTQMTILSGPYYVDGYLWWNITGSSGTGYSAVAYWLFPDVVTPTPPQLPDVLPQNITLNASTVATGGTLTVAFNIRNQGSGNAAATTTRLRLNQSSTVTSASDTSLGDVSTPIIAANSVTSGLNKVVTIPSGTAAGTYYVWVVADNGNVLTQSNYNNDDARSSAFTVTVTPTPSQLQLILDESGPEPNQAAAVDSALFFRDPFSVINWANLTNLGLDRNTRVLVFVTNLQLAQGETPSSVIVNLFDANSQSYDIAAEDVRSVPNFNFMQVIFRLPDNLAPGICTVKVKAHGQISNLGSLRIKN